MNDKCRQSIKFLITDECFCFFQVFFFTFFFLTIFFFYFFKLFFIFTFICILLILTYFFIFFIAFFAAFFFSFNLIFVIRTILFWFPPIFLNSIAIFISLLFFNKTFSSESFNGNSLFFFIVHILVHSSRGWLFLSLTWNIEFFIITVIYSHLSSMTRCIVTFIGYSNSTLF